ncbi:adenylate/guanylate cyclase domain-containing protein [Hymenobacter monticola]|uniref:Adenylate/guanylate cyclase domain-containing protein n=1 Tax=Hymenobacter monticola TaxID=1705399 RepID=A0ABY4BB87_9BACT|nr:adenylate/guanylate cyclase domain-containing protein [Hymenobacter monticola]UOE36424.1 adenylate/guanylate cyclase domain-containing protein [Hymenobacter monticola]
MKAFLPLYYRYYLRSVLLLCLAFMLGLTLLIYLIRGQFNPLNTTLVLAVGGPVGLLVGVLEVYVFPRLLTNRPLWLRILLTTSLHLLVFGVLLWLGQHLIQTLRSLVALDFPTARALDHELVQLGLLPSKSPDAPDSSLTRLLIIYGLLSLGLTTLYQVGRKMGLRSLSRVVLGQYNQPEEEKRIFLFADIKDSTVLAEQLGNTRYSALIRDFFGDVGLPIAATQGEVYQYVGDEVVVTWKWPAGLQQGNCLRCFFDMQAAIDRRRPYYLRTYGVVPAFKAGVHGGLVVATQVGDIKTELVFHGDVLNTTARIQAQCNALGSIFLVSSAILEALPPGLPYQLRPLGAFTLRGKQQAVEIVDVQQPSLEVARSASNS